MIVAIVEDEAVVARRLERSVRAALEGRVDQLVILPTLAMAIERLRAERVDLLFLDLNLNGQDGFRVLAEAAAGRFETIVVSAHEDEAIRAFEFGVADFVAKPWTEARLRLAIDRALGRAGREQGRARHLAVRHAGAVELVEFERVLAIRGADDYAELLMDSGATRLHEKTLAQLERLLPARFIRTHRSWIVNLDRVRGWESAPAGRATLELDALRVPVGRTYRAVVMDQLRREPGVDS